MRRAVRNNHSTVVAWLQNHVAPRPEFAVKLVEDAVCCGDLATLQWLIERFDVNTHQALDLAAGKGQWDVAIWIVENCEMKAHPEEPYDELFGRATGDGSLEFLKLATSRKLWTPNAATASEMISSAAAAGHLETVKWLHEELGINSAGDGYFLAVIGGHLEVLKYLHEKHLRNDSTLSLMDAAARNGFLDVMQWLHANSMQKCTTNAMDCAATIGHLDVVQWLHEHRSEGCTSAAMDLAASNGHMDVVKWLHSHRSEGCKWATLGWAAEFGHLDMVQWLHNNRQEYFFCPDAMDTAAAQGCLDLVKWLNENRSEGCTGEAMNDAAAYGHLEVVKWLHENRSEGCTRSAMDRAVANGHLDIVQWLHENRYEGCSTDAMDCAASHETLNW